MHYRYKTFLPGIEHWRSMVKCQAACPIRTDAGRYVQLIAEGKEEEAYLVAASPNMLASVCGRICSAPCEDNCRRGKIDAPISIRALKRFICEKYGLESLNPRTQEKIYEEAPPTIGNQWLWHLPVLRKKTPSGKFSEKVAVVGAGPAGLACTHDLAVMGYAVTVFEESNIAGGMMKHGIPEYRLPRAVMEKEISRVLELGVEMKLMTPLNQKFTLAGLKKEGYSAIFLSVGVQKGRDLNIPGSSLDGVIKAMDYLININNGYKVQLGKKVLVIGGGFVAFDAARTALRSNQDEGEMTGNNLVAAVDAARLAKRAGVTEVHVASLESFAEMPVLRTTQGKEEFEEAQKEGIIFHPQRGPKQFVGENGKLHAVEFIGVQRTYDAEGRFSPVYDTNQSEIFETDSVILAIGQKADLSFLQKEDGIRTTPAGLIEIDKKTLATSAPGVFAGGDVAFGPRNLVEALANGKQGAQSIHNYLRAIQSDAMIHLSVEKIPTKQYRMAPEYDKKEREKPPTVSLNRRTGISEVETGYDDKEAHEQAERCLYCHINTIYDTEKCVLCGRCVDICPEFCLKLVPIQDLDLSEEDQKNLQAFYQHSEGETLSAMLKDDEKCIRCGMCAIRCPTDAMTMEVFYTKEEEVVQKLEGK